MIVYNIFGYKFNFENIKAKTAFNLYISNDLIKLKFKYNGNDYEQLLA